MALIACQILIDICGIRYKPVCFNDDIREDTTDNECPSSFWEFQYAGLIPTGCN